MSGLISEMTDIRELNAELSRTESELRVLMQRKNNILSRKRQLISTSLKEGATYVKGNTFFKLNKLKDGFAAGLVICCSNDSKEFVSLYSFFNDIDLLTYAVEATEEQVRAVDDYIRSVLALKPGSD